ncbi:MAG: hypothetical protein V3U21_01355 [Thermodesulfobacteriota bacterium]
MQLIIAVCKFAPDARIVTVHMESMGILKITGDSLRNVADKHHVGPDYPLIPHDGDGLKFWFLQAWSYRLRGT